jgi:hypothetical protein
MANNEQPGRHGPDECDFFPAQAHQAAWCIGFATAQKKDVGRVREAECANPSRARLDAPWQAGRAVREQAMGPSSQAGLFC